MVNEFIGRTAELETLASQYAASTSNLVPVYGRRRIGKSELILHFLRDKPGLYFLAQRASAEVNLQGYCQLAAAWHQDPLLRRAANWEEALRETVNRWRRREKLVLALDEFQWAAQASPEITSVLQGLWDREWQKSGRVMLLLCGSQIGFMEREVLGGQSPLFGRRTGQLAMQAFDPWEAARFHPRLAVEDQAVIYFVTGGVAYYLREFRNRSLEENIREAFLDPHSPLALEPEFLLREELRDLAPFHSILMAIGAGETRYQEIARKTGGNPHNLNYYLKQLESLGYIGKRFPVREKAPPGPQPRRVAYEITDALLRFWFHFVFPQESQLRALPRTVAFQTLIQPALPAYWGHCFEPFCRDLLPRIYAAEGVRWSACGEYWDPRVQIDVVGVRRDHWTDLAECRWGGVPSLAALRAELLRKAPLFPNKLQHSLGFRLFVRQAPKGRVNLPDCRIHTLADLYRLQDGGREPRGPRQGWRVHP